MNELIQVSKKGGGKLKIIQRITNYGSVVCDDFAQKLLNDPDEVKTLRRGHENNDESFIRKVLHNWLERDDDDKEDLARPRTWAALAECVKDTPGLPGLLAGDIRKQFASDNS